MNTSTTAQLGSAQCSSSPDIKSVIDRVVMMELGRQLEDGVKYLASVDVNKLVDAITSSLQPATPTGGEEPTKEYFAKWSRVWHDTCETILTLSPASARAAWRFEIQHGPDGQTDYAWVYDGSGNLVCTAKTHHAIAIVTALSPSSAGMGSAINALEEIQNLGNKITDPKNAYGIRMGNIAHAALIGLRDIAQPSAGSDDPSRDDLIESIQYAIGALSTHIEAFHDFDYEPHQVPPELDELRRLQHHLEGALINSKGEFCSIAPAKPPLNVLIDQIAALPCTIDCTGKTQPSLADQLIQMARGIQKQRKAHPLPSTHSRPLCSKCGLEDGACICAHLAVSSPDGAPK